MSRIPLKTRLGLTIMQAYRSLQTSLHELTYLFWECTLRCNLSCVHCGSDCQKSLQTTDMPLADFLGVLDEVTTVYNPRKTMIAVTGGEPLLRRDLEKCGEAFLARGFPWGIVTNGYALTNERLKSLISAGLRSITISLDGLNGSHDWFRGAQGSFEKARNGILGVVNYSGLAFDVVTCVHQRNIGELEELRAMLVRDGVKQWRLFTVFPKGRAKDAAALQLTTMQFKSLMEFIAATWREGKIRASYGCEGFLGGYEGKVRDNYFFCRAGVNIGSVLSDGSISACPSLRNDYIQGNIYRDSFIDCWNNRYQKMRNRTWTRTGVCSDCKVYCWCLGNGLHVRDEQSGELLQCQYRMLENASVLT